MTNPSRAAATLSIAAVLGGFAVWAGAQDPGRKPIDPNSQKASAAPFDAVADAQQSQPPSGDRPEQKKQPQDQGEKFDAGKAPPVSTALEQQPDEGKIKGFDFYHDPLKADLEAFLASSQRCVNGEVVLETQGGTVAAVAEQSPHILNAKGATYAQSADWGVAEAEGFIKLYGMSSTLWAEVNR